MKKRLLITISLILISGFTNGCMLPFFGNEPPIIQSSPSLTAALGSTYNYQVEAVDDNDANLAYSLLVYPNGMTIDNSTGLIEWVPQESQLGTNQVQVKVSDGWSSTTQEFSVEVSIIQLSSIDVIPDTMSLKVGSSQTISYITATYSDSSSILIEKTACNYQSNSNSAAVSASGVVTANIAGNATITVSYTEDDITKSDTIFVSISSFSGG